MVRKMLVKMLYRLGSDVHEVQDGQDAIDNVKEKLLMKSEEEPSSEVEGGGKVMMKTNQWVERQS